jgi:hypothetical protein
MRRLFFLFVLFVGISAPSISQTEATSLFHFYRAADSISQHPPFKSELTVVCQKLASNQYVTFIGTTTTKKVSIVVVTTQPVTDILRRIALVVDFDGIKPTIGNITTWGYVFDRNGDKKIDYLALMDGAAAVKDTGFPADFPARGKPLTEQQIEYFVSHCQMIFSHWADDNFDGKIDGMVQSDLDPVRDWVKQYMIVLNSGKSGNPSEAWTFRDNIKNRHKLVLRSPDALVYHPIGSNADRISAQTFLRNSEILKILNDAVQKCGVGSQLFSGK